jgi:oligoribonuclease NrnB/cAMP/cGMP phosphodiesterase (DHH superfamily)
VGKSRWSLACFCIKVLINMVSLPKPEVILTHESDLDGLVSGLLLQRLAQKLFNQSIRLEAYPYDAWRQRVMRENCAWTSDFYFDPRLDKPGWVVIDHHPTQTPAKNAWLIHDLGKSASMLCYDLCKEQGLGSETLEKLVRYSNIADLFLSDDPEFPVAVDYANLVKTYQFWNLYAVIEGQLERLVDHPLLEVMAVKRRVEDPIGLNWSEANIVELAPRVGYADTVLGNTNLIAFKLLEKKNAAYDVVVTLFRKGNGTIIASFRSRNGQALKLAEKFQGGGHPNAAGATLPRSVSRIPDAVDYMRKVLNPAVTREAQLNSLESIFDSLKL